MHNDPADDPSVDEVAVPPGVALDRLETDPEPRRPGPANSVYLSPSRVRM